MKRVAWIAAAAIALALALWLAFEGEPTSDGSPRPSASARPSAAAIGATSPPANPDSPISGAQDSRSELAASERAAIDVEARPAEQPEALNGKLVLRLATAAGGPAPGSAAMTLQLPSGKRTVRAEGDLSRVEIERIEPGEWPLAVRASGFHDVDLVVAIGSNTPSELTLKLWPLDWVLVRAVTTAGEPYTEVARRLGLAPAQMFEQGFQVWTAIDAPPDMLNWPQTPPLANGASFSRISLHYGRDDFDLRDIARVKRASPGPVWIALAFHRRFFGWAQLAPGVNVAQFELAAEDITEQFGSLSFRVVDAGSGAPLRDARGSLDAEVAGLRRPDTSNFGPDDLGGFSARPLLPGEYDLTVDAPRRGEHYQRVRIQAGERLDLGELALDFAEQLVIRVVDESGQPALAHVQLGAWRAGAPVEDCVTPRAWVTGDGGGVSVPMPSGKVVLRAERMNFDTGGRLWTDRVGAAFAVFDPASRATEVEIRFAFLRRAVLVPPPERGSATQLRVLASFEIGVAQRSLDTERPLDFALATGRYTAALLDDNDNVLRRYPFEVTAALNEPIALQ